MRVLSIDDEPDVCELIARLLKRRGHECKTALSAEAAKELLEHESFELIISDFRMPGMTGGELFDYLAAHHQRMAERMVFVTAGDADPEKLAFFRRTGRPCLNKPFDISGFQVFLDQMEHMVASLPSGA